MREAAPGRTAFILAGGGSLGAVEVGMLKALSARGTKPDLVVGSSVGAINGAYFAAQPDAAGVARLESIWHGLRRPDIFPLEPVGGLLAFLGRRTHFIDPARLAELLEKHLTFRRLEDTAIPCHVIATDVLGGAEVCLSKGPAIEALLASAAIPAVFPPVRIGDRFLIDGAFANNTPVSTALSFGATRLVVLPTGFSCSIERPPAGAIAMALHAVNLLMARQLLLDIERFSARAEVVVLPPLCPLGISSYDFSHSDELIDRAAQSTQRWLEDHPLPDGCVPSSLKPHRHRRADG